MSQPPPLPIDQRARGRRRAKIVIGIVCGLLVLGGVSLFLLFRYVTASGLTRPMDNMFGDQSLKTAVALIELHKTRYGRYPDSVRDLRFTGNWDPISLNSVSYYPNPDRSAYYVEVHRGWIGKPDLQMPAEFWQGTGYSPELKPPPQ